MVEDAVGALHPHEVAASFASGRADDAHPGRAG